MPNLKISQLIAGAPAQTSDLIPIARSGANFSITPGEIIALITVFGAAGSSHSTGFVPDPGPTAGTTEFLREDATWAVPPGSSYSVFGGAGGGASIGLVPIPPSIAGSTEFLCENATWAVPSGTTYAVFGAAGGSHSPGLVPDPGSTAGTTEFLREDATWAVPPTSIPYTLKTGIYTFADSDRGLFILTNDSSNRVYTLPTPSGSLFINGWSVWLKNGSSTSTVTLTPAGITTVDGMAALVMPSHTALQLECDGTNYHTTSISPVGNNAANLAFLSPNGSAGMPNMRSIVAADLPQQPYVITSFYGGNGVPASQNLLRHAIAGNAVNTVTFASGLSGSYVGCVTAPTSPFIITVSKNSVSQGTMTIAALATTGTFSFTSTVTTVPGDLWDFIAPAVADATCAGVYFTISGTRV